MKATVQKDALKSALDAARTIVRGKTLLPIFSCVRLTVDGGLRLECTSLTEELTLDVTATGMAKGTVCVNAADFASRVAVMPDGDIMLALKDEKLTIGNKGKARRFALDTLPADQFPEMHPGPGGGVELSADTLGRMVSAVLFCVGDGIANAAMNGARLAAQGGELLVTATDGRALSRIGAACVADIRDVTIPTKALALIRDSFEGAVTMATDDTRLFFSQPGRVLAALPCAGAFPGVSSVFREESRTTAQVDRQALLETLKALAVAADGLGKATLRVDGGAILVTCGDGSDRVEAETSGKSPTLGVDVRIITGALASLDSETVEFGIDGELDQIMIRPAELKDDTTRVVVVMPMRI